MEKFDVVIIGAGPGGYPAAIRAAQLGASVAIVEKEREGGTCLNWGCIPTKTLLASSEFFFRARNSGQLGLTFKDLTIDYGTMVRRKGAVVEKLRSGIRHLLKANGVSFIEGEASFANRTRLVVRNGGSETLLQAGRIIVATGSESVLPGFLPRNKRVVDSKGFLALNKLPSSLIVLGGGVIGCEFACMAAQLGVAVTIVELLDDIVVVLDPDIRRVLRQHLGKDLGVRILTGKPIANVKATAKGVTATFDDKPLKADLLLAAVGRKPVSAALALDCAGIAPTEQGFIPTDSACRTEAPTIFAVGDVTGGSLLAHAATAQGVVAAENAVRNTQRPVETVVPACIFTSPEIGSVGLTETQAKTDGMAVRTGKFMFGALGKAMAMGDTTGFVKWIADTETDQLLGAHAIGPHATELISEAAVAIRAELTVEELGRTIHCHPTLSEAWMEAAHAAHGTCVHTAPRRR